MCLTDCLVWRVEPGQVYTEGRTAKKCIATAPQLNAYKNCLTNFKVDSFCQTNVAKLFCRLGKGIL